jgi:endoglucanase
MQAAVNAAGTNFYEIKAQVVNKSGWPARHLTHGSFRYYFTLDAGTSPSQVTVTSAYNQCLAPSGPTQFSGSIYYVTISCEGQDIAPAGQSAFHREVQFRLTFPGAHDPKGDWSFQGIPTTAGGTPVTANDVVLYDGATAVWGSAPSGSGTPPPTTPPPTTPPPTTPPPTTPPPTTPPPTGGAACAVVYKVTNSWSGGFQADVRVSNTGSAAVKGWTLTWAFGGDQKIGSGWSGTFSQSGQKVTVTDAGYNGSLAPGAAADVGFTATYGSSNAAPTGFALNGAACTS